MAVQDIHEALGSGNGPTTAGVFFVSVVDKITERVGEIVVDIEDRVAEIEDTIASAETAELRPRLAELRRESISLRRYIAPQRDMLARLPHERIAWLTDSNTFTPGFHILKGSTRCSTPEAKGHRRPLTAG